MGAGARHSIVSVAMVRPAGARPLPRARHPLDTTHAMPLAPCCAPRPAPHPLPAHQVRATFFGHPPSFHGPADFEVLAGGWLQGGRVGTAFEALARETHRQRQAGYAYTYTYECGHMHTHCICTAHAHAHAVYVLTRQEGRTRQQQRREKSEQRQQARQQERHERP